MPASKLSISIILMMLFMGIQTLRSQDHSTRDWPTYVYPDAFSFITTPLSGAFLGQVTVDGFQAEDDGVDIIAAFEPVSGICVGTDPQKNGG